MLNKHAFGQYPSNRMTLSEDVIETVELLRKTGARKSGIRQYIGENSSGSPSARRHQPHCATQEE